MTWEGWAGESGQGQKDGATSLMPLGVSKETRHAH